MNPEDFIQKVEEHGGFGSIKLSPHMRFRAGQRRLDWESLKDKIRNGEIADVEINRNPNQSIPFTEAVIMFITVNDQNLTVPMYFLENGTMKAVTVMRE